MHLKDLLGAWDLRCVLSFAWDGNTLLHWEHSNLQIKVKIPFKFIDTVHRYMYQLQSNAIIMAISTCLRWRFGGSLY